MNFIEATKSSWIDSLLPNWKQFISFPQKGHHIIQAFYVYTARAKFG